MPIYQRTRASVLDALIAVCALSALASAVHSADASDPPRNPGLPCGYEVAAIIKGPVHPFFGQASLIATGMNEHGWATGFYFWLDTDHAFYWTPDTGLHTIPLPVGFNRAIANDVNDHGVVVGDMEGPGQHWRGFVYDTTTGTMTILEPVQNIGSAQCWANAINNDGVVVGARSLGETEQPYNAFIWTPSEDDPSEGTYTDLGVMNGPNSTATDINEKGDAIGWTGTFTTLAQGFLWDEGATTLLGPIELGLSSFAYAINNHAEIAGSGHIDPDQLPGISAGGAVWHNGSWSLVPMPVGCTGAGLNAVSDSGLLAGRCVGEDIEIGVVWSNNDHLILNDAVEIDGTYNIRWARDVNEGGRVLSIGTLNGKTVGFVLDPIDAPLADLTGDCTVGPDDLSVLLSEWDKRRSPADLNEDGVVNGADLAILLGAWTR